jgi:flagellar motor switch protein FliM
MAEKSLSQKEIDALLAILPADGSPLPSKEDQALGSARVYDFRSPDKFSKEQIRTLQMIHENFARRCSSSLAAYLRTPVQLTFVHVEQGSFADFMQNIITPSLVTVLSMDPLPGRILVTLDSPSATIAIDRLLGGFGLPADSDHEITDIEQSLIKGVIGYIAESLHEAWKNVIDLNITIDDISLNPEFVQVALPSDAAVFLAFETIIRDGAGTMSVCIPYSVLKPIITELSPHTWVAGEARGAGVYRDALLKHLKHVEVDITALLGKIPVSFDDLLHLQEGDVLVLDSNAKKPVPIMLGSDLKYFGRPGLVGHNLSVLLTGTVSEDEADG